MVLEALINPIKAERRPWETIIIGAVYASVGALISLLIFPQFEGILMVSFAAMMAIPLVYGAIKLEEKKTITIDSESRLLREHGRILLSFIFLFIGFTLAFVGWYVILPSDDVSFLFEDQISTVMDINAPDGINNPVAVSGHAVSTSGALFKITLNNVKVLFFCLLFSFFMGFGAIFIITWNASILATVIGALIRGSDSFLLTPFILARYFLHGLPEILAYIIGGLAGGIISIAIVRHDFGSKKFHNILKDSMGLTVVALVLIIIAALIEVFISPIVF